MGPGHRLLAFPNVDARPALSRGYATWLLYGAFGCMAFLLNGLGAVLPPLQADLRVSRGEVAFYPSLFAAGLVVVGLSGAPLVGRIGRAGALRLAIVAIIVGGLLIAAPGRLATLMGALLLGLGAALLIQLVPAVLATSHPHAPTAAIGEANGLASAASVLAPLAVSASLAAGFGWRIGYLALPLLALVAIALPIWRLPLAEAGEAAVDGPPGVPAPMTGRWFDLLLAVSVEFCLVFWAASAFIAWDHASASQGAALASLFLVGMAVARALSARIIRLVPDPRTLVLLCAAVAGAGFAIFWSAPSLSVAAAGLLVAGLGVALLYPTTVSRVVAAWPHAPDRAAARAALASGVAIGGAPFVLAQMSDATGLRTAFLIVPVMLLVLATRGGRPEVARAAS
jgi:predicted MFS family arabinose efflux permease